MQQYPGYTQMPFVTVPLVDTSYIQQNFQGQTTQEQVVDPENLEVTTTINGESYDELIKIVWQREFNQLFCQLSEKPVAK